MRGSFPVALCPHDEWRCEHAKGKAEEETHGARPLLASAPWPLAYLGYYGLKRSLHHLVRQEEEGRRYGELQSFGSLKVDDQLKLHRLFYGRSAGLAPLRILSTYVAPRRYASVRLIL